MEALPALSVTAGTGAVLFGLVGLESVGIPLPGEAMLITAAIFAGATHELDIVPVIAAATGAKNGTIALAKVTQSGWSGAMLASPTEPPLRT